MISPVCYLFVYLDSRYIIFTNSRDLFRVELDGSLMQDELSLSGIIGVDFDYRYMSTLKPGAMALLKGLSEL